MNCRDSESLILTERDGGLTKDQHSALLGHVAACPGCHQLRIRLNTALDSLQSDVAAVPVPDAAKAWRDLQVRLHETTGKPARKRPLAPVIWFGAPLAAAAAIAFVFLSRSGPHTAGPTPETSFEPARADYVEAGDAGASTMVYVDKDSGWLVVWAVNGETQTKG